MSDKKDPNIIKDKQKKIEQYLKEKTASIKLRQTKINNWIRNEELYNGVTQKTLLTRANLNVPKVFEGVQTMSSRLGLSPEFEFVSKPEGDDMSPELMKHIVIEDMEESDFDTIYQNSKVETGIYGRGIIKLIPGNNGNKYELVDTLSFLISPIGKNTKSALYQGQQFIYKTIGELEDEAEEYGYDMEELKKLKENKATSDTQSDNSSEAAQKNLRMADMGLSNTNQYGSKVAEITEWYTYINQDDVDQLRKIPYVMTVANDTYLLRCVPIKEVGLPRFPFVSYATYPRGITFWCPSVADVLRDPNLAMNVTLNQQIDNNTYRNFGQMFVDSSSGLKQSSINPRPLGVTPVTVNGTKSVKDMVWQFTPPGISDAMATFQQISSVAENAAGLSASPIGKQKMSVTHQAALSAQIDAKTNMARQNIMNAMKELVQLSADTIAMNLTEPRDVKIFGYQDITITSVTNKNFKGIKLLAKVTPRESSQENKAIKQKAAIQLYEILKDDPKIPGQMALRKQLLKNFELSPTEANNLLSQEEQSSQAPMQQPNTGQPPAPESPQQGQQQPAQTQASPLLGQTGQAAQAQVPPTIR